MIGEVLKYVGAVLLSIVIVGGCAAVLFIARWDVEA